MNVNFRWNDPNFTYACMSNAVVTSRWRRTPTSSTQCHKVWTSLHACKCMCNEEMFIYCDWIGYVCCVLALTVDQSVGIAVATSIVATAVAGNAATSANANTVVIVIAIVICVSISLLKIKLNASSTPTHAFTHLTWHTCEKICRLFLENGVKSSKRKQRSIGDLLIT